MQMAMAVGGCTAEDADLLRRAMGSKRGIEKISTLKATLYAGMAENGIDEETADVIYAKIEAFANFGFAESHSISFGLLVYASSWFKLHYPAAFLAALLRAQPMGFYSPQTLTADARRHGVEVRRPDILLSGANAVLEPLRRLGDTRIRAAPRAATPASPRPSRPSGRSTAAAPTSLRPTAATAPSPCASDSPRSAASASRWPSASWPSARPTGRTAAWPTCRAASG